MNLTKGNIMSRGVVPPEVSPWEKGEVSIAIEAAYDTMYKMQVEPLLETLRFIVHDAPDAHNMHYAARQALAPYAKKEDTNGR